MSASLALEGPGQNCLDRALLTFEEFFAGETTQAEIDEAWVCAAETLAMFKKHVRGRDGDSYAAIELRAFIERYFLTEYKISDGLLVEMMRLKQAILGGGLESITKAELDEAGRVLNALRVESVKILPYMKVVLLESDPERLRGEPEFIERAVSQVVGTSHVIGTLLGKSVSAYRFSDAERLLRELDKLYVSKSKRRGPARFIEYLPVVSALKAFFIRPGGDAIAPNEWYDLVAGAGRFYGMYLRYDYLIGEASLKSVDGLRQITTIAKDFFLLLEGSVKAKEGGVIRFKEIDGLLEQLYERKLIDMPFQEPTAKQVARHLVQKVLNPARDGHRDRVAGLSAAGVEWLKRDFFGWVEMEQAWDRMSPAGGSLSVNQVRARLKILSPAYADTHEEMRYLVERPFPLVFDSLGVVRFESDPGAMAVDRASWTSLNWKRLFIRVVGRGYSVDHWKERFIGIRKTELKAFYDDIFGMASEMGVLDPREPELWSSLFDESNLFMFSADGDDRLNFAEATEILAFVLSGSQMSRPAYEDLRENCRNYEPDVFGLPMLDVQCYRQRFRTSFATYYKALPGWAQMVGSIPDDDYPGFREVLETAARATGYADTHFESKDLDKSTMLFQYIEALFTRFDKDRNGFFSVEESMAAYPLLRPILKELSGFTDEKELTTLFTYIVKYGESPDSNIWTGLKYLWWKANRSNWSYEADRWQVLKVVANLRSARKEKRKSTPPAPEGDAAEFWLRNLRYEP